MSETEFVARGALDLGAIQGLVLERSHDLVTVITPGGLLLYGSPSWQDVLGWDAEALVGTPVLDLVHPDDRGRVGSAFHEAANGTEIDSVVARMRAADGRYVTVDSSETPVFGADGTVDYVVSTARDVSEREELRDRVREVDALYRFADAIARASSLDELFADALDNLIEAIGADRASLLLFDDGGVMRFRAWRGLSDAYRAATDGHSPWSRDTTDPEPVLVCDVADAGFEERLERAVRDEGIAALAFVPLVHGDTLLGKFMLYRDAPHDWTDREIRLARTIASHLASATVRTLAREALRDSRLQLETIMRTVDEGIIVQTHGNRIVYANDAAIRSVGFESREEMLAAPSEERLARFEILDEFGEPLAADDLPGRRALAGEPTERTVQYRSRLTGEERWSVIRANPVYGGDGEVVMSVSVIRDVTASRSSTERLSFLARASHFLNATLEVESTLGNLADVAVPDFAGHVTVDLFQDNVLRCVGARHVVPEKSELMLQLREEYPPTVEAHPVQRALRTGEPQFVPDVQAEATTMAHDERHAAAIADLGNSSGIVVPLTARGRTFGAITFGRVPPQPLFDQADFELAIELGRRASVALDNALLHREVEARADAAEALEFVDDGVFLIDRDDVIRLWNAAAVKTFRVKPGKAIGRHVDEVISSWESIANRVTAAPEPSAGARAPETLPVDVKGDERWLSMSAVRFAGGTVYAFRDMTEERAVEQLKSDFVSTVSHELRTPLAAIYGAALTLQRDDVRLEASQRRGLLDVISAEADRLARIVNDILWASRLDSGQMGVAIEHCDAAKLAAQVIDALRHHAPASVELRLEAASALPPVAADPDKLRQVLTNLVDNAVKYSPDGGVVRVSVAPAGTRIRFRVEDEGLGVPPAEQARIFEKFFRLDPQLTRGVGGTGLGLYICRELVHRMHGRIWVASDGRRGSTFTVDLPAAS
ncbi:MAG TPA: PAS domain S-box protein [Gaiellaceae bacterium]|nr:PAS domain S-box protein [Gaiellaceae bacterium]